jgi:hypothetical protein
MIILLLEFSGKSSDEVIAIAKKSVDDALSNKTLVINTISFLKAPILE